MSAAALRTRVQRLEASVIAAEPLLVYVRCFSGPALRITGPNGATWLRRDDETPEDFAQRAMADAHLAIRQCPNPPPVWVLAERHTLIDRPFNKEELFA